MNAASAATGGAAELQHTKASQLEYLDPFLSENAVFATTITTHYCSTATKNRYSVLLSREDCGFSLSYSLR